MFVLWLFVRFEVTNKKITTCVCIKPHLLGPQLALGFGVILGTRPWPPVIFEFETITNMVAQFANTGTSWENREIGLGCHVCKQNRLYHLLFLARQIPPQ